MAAREPVTITLGGRDFLLRPLTFAQVEAIEASVATSASGNVAAARGVIVAGLSRDHAEAAGEVKAGDIEADAREIAEAMAVILRHGGFLPAVPGEVRAAAPNASDGAGSEAA